MRTLLEQLAMPLRAWTVHQSQYLVKDQWMTLRADHCETQQGVSVAPYYVTESRNWVHVVAFDADNRILLTRQYRHGRGIISTELPCGMVDPGEQPEAAIRRELKEETGAEVAELKALAPMASNPARDSNHIYPFYATGTRIVAEQNLEPTEEIEYFFAEVSEFFELLERGEFVSSLQLGTVFMALRARGLLASVC